MAKISLDLCLYVTIYSIFNFIMRLHTLYFNVTDIVRHRLFHHCILKVWPELYDPNVCCVPPAQNDTSSRISVKLRQPGEGVVAVQADGVWF